MPKFKHKSKQEGELYLGGKLYKMVDGVIEVPEAHAATLRSSPYWTALNEGALDAVGNKTRKVKIVTIPEEAKLAPKSAVTPNSKSSKKSQKGASAPKDTNS